MPRLILLLAVAAVIYILFRRAQAMPPHKRRAEFIKLGLGIAVVAVVGLTLAGKMHWVGAALPGLLVMVRQLLPTLLRFFPMLASLRGQSSQGPSQGQQSTVNTDTLRMHLDHDSGALSGEVLLGPFKDWQLDELDTDQLKQLYQHCEAQDADALQLLDSYLEQRFGADGPFETDPPPAGQSGDMSRSEALEVLGLEEGADKDAVVAAHRTLMQKLHPDRGGNDYLAAKINRAKDVLLG